MNPPTEQPLMTLEETAAILRSDLAVCQENMRICDLNDYEEEEALLKNRIAAYSSALHHLEAGKRDAERYRRLREHAEAEFIEVKGHGFDGYFEEGKDLDAALDCLPAPTQTEQKEKLG